MNMVLTQGNLECFGLVLGGKTSTEMELKLLNVARASNIVVEKDIFFA